MGSVSQVTSSDPNPAARDVHHRSSASLQSAVWTLSGKIPRKYIFKYYKHVSYHSHDINNGCLSLWAPYVPTSSSSVVRGRGRISLQRRLKYQTINWLISANLSSAAAAVWSAGPEEALPAVPGPHDLHRGRSQDWNQGVPVSVQTEEVELQHRGQHICVWTGHADRWVDGWKQWNQEQQGKSVFVSQLKGDGQLQSSLCWRFKKKLLLLQLYVVYVGFEIKSDFSI